MDLETKVIMIVQQTDWILTPQVAKKYAVQVLNNVLGTGPEEIIGFGNVRHVTIILV